MKSEFFQRFSMNQKLQNIFTSATQSISERRNKESLGTWLRLTNGQFPENNSRSGTGGAADVGSGQELPCSRIRGSLVPQGPLHSLLIACQSQPLASSHKKPVSPAIQKPCYTIKRSEDPGSPSQPSSQPTTTETGRPDNLSLTRVFRAFLISKLPELTYSRLCCQDPKQQTRKMFFQRKQTNQTRKKKKKVVCVS